MSHKYEIHLLTKFSLTLIRKIYQDKSVKYDIDMLTNFLLTLIEKIYTMKVSLVGSYSFPRLYDIVVGSLMNLLVFTFWYNIVHSESPHGFYFLFYSTQKASLLI